ncbi:MAG: histidine-type phosphatase [Terracidiphilus sp.]
MKTPCLVPLSRLLLCACLSAAAAGGQTPAAQPAPAPAETLRFVAIVSRHGVRSPTGKLDQLNQYSRQLWPAWSVPPGYLTEHGARLMTLLGAYDRAVLVTQGLLSPSSCGDASHIAIVADSDQRTRETGKALAAGLAPGCAIPVRALPEGTEDPLFHSLAAGVGHPDKALAVAALSGRIGANPQAIALAFRPQLEQLSKVLDACAAASCSGPAPQSLFDLPATLGPGKGDHLVELRTPLTLAATMSENLLLEYAEGMPEVGWGRVDLNTLRGLMDLHTASEEITQRTPYVARAQASNLLFHLLASLDQAAAGRAVPGALTDPGDKLLILSGHDTNLANIAGVLGLNWIADGRRDDTPPGGALIFELWKKPGADAYAVKVYFQAQTLDQMRSSTPLTLASPPERVPVFVSACGQAEMSCTWDGFRSAVRAAIDPSFVR